MALDPRDGALELAAEQRPSIVDEGSGLAWPVFVCALVATAGVVFAVTRSTLVFTNDGGHHVLTGVLHRHLDDAGRGYATWLERAAPLTNHAWSWLFSPLEALFAWRRAHQTAFALTALAWAWSVYALARGAQATRRVAGLLAFAFALHWSLYLGFFSYSIATAAALALVALSFSSTLAPRVRGLALVAGFFVVALGHLFAAQAGALLLAALSVCAPRAQRRARVLEALAVAAPLLVLTALSASIQRGLTTQMQQQSGAEWLSFGDRVLGLGRFSAGGPWPRSLAALAVVLAALARVALGLRARTLTERDKGLGLALVLYVLLSLALPAHLRTWEYLSSRFALWSLAVGLALLPLDRLAQRVTVPLVGLAVALSLAWSAHYNASLEAQTADARALVEAPLRRTGLVLPVLVRPQLAQQGDPLAWSYAESTPLASLGSYMAAAQGGVPFNYFAVVPSLHDFVFRELPERTRPSVSQRAMRALDEGDLRYLRLLDHAAMAGSFYEALLFQGPPRSRAHLAARGYRADFARGELLVARFVGCPFALRSRVENGAIIARLRWTAEDEIAEEIQLRPGERRLFSRAPCGPAALEVRDVGGAPVRCDAVDERGVLAPTRPETLDCGAPAAR